MNQKAGDVLNEKIMDECRDAAGQFIAEFELDDGDDLARDRLAAIIFAVAQDGFVAGNDAGRTMLFYQIDSLK